MFRNKTLPIYGMLIAEQLPATTEAMRNVILYNARKAGDKDPQVILEKQLDLNGRKVGEIRFLAGVQAIEFIFATRYFANDDGNVQVVCYTGQPLFYKYEAECQQFISGLTLN